MRRQGGQVLLTERPVGKAWAGWWEFPGGKIEDGETAFEALQRELDEELGTKALEAYPWLTRIFAYPEKTVKLHFFMVRRWADEPHGREGQHLSWQMPTSLTVGPMLPANEPILHALNLPATYAISNLAELGSKLFFAKLEQALIDGLRLIQLREKHLSRAEFSLFAERVIALARPHGARVLLNADIELARALMADGVHLSSAALGELQHKPEGLLSGASCHNAQELGRAQTLGLDFVVLSPVLPTLSHADAPTLGWFGFGELIRDYPIAVYALGGMLPQYMQNAWQHGAHGIAMQRRVWL